MFDGDACLAAPRGFSSSVDDAPREDRLVDLLTDFGPTLHVNLVPPDSILLIKLGLEVNSVEVDVLEVGEGNLEMVGG